jgi:hypothetical protein
MGEGSEGEKAAGQQGTRADFIGRRMAMGW